jgi:hypothetical protein
MDRKDIRDVGRWFNSWCVAYTNECGSVGRDEFIEDALEALRYYVFIEIEEE